MATPGALLLIAGIGLLYYAIFSPSGILAKNPVSVPSGDASMGMGASSGGITAISMPVTSGSLGQFAAALVKAESGGNYTLYNRKCYNAQIAKGNGPPNWATGGSNRHCAYGKYQFMYGSWQTYTKRYFGHTNVPLTPKNQDTLALKEFERRYKVWGDWRLVALSWRNGEGYVRAHLRANGGKLNMAQLSSGAQKYITNVTNWMQTVDPSRYGFSA
jgi:hypothetical protein